MAHYRTESFQQKHSYMLNMLCSFLSFLFFSVFIWPQEPKYGNERIRSDLFIARGGQMAKVSDSTGCLLECASNSFLIFTVAKMPRQAF